MTGLSLCWWTHHCREVEILREAIDIDGSAEHAGIVGSSENIALAVKQIAIQKVVQDVVFL